MDVNSGTLGEVIAAGERLLAGTRPGRLGSPVAPLAPATSPVAPLAPATSPVAPLAPATFPVAPLAPAVVPQQVRPDERVAPVPDGEWLTADDIALQVGWDPWTVDEHLDRGTLHGHDDSGEWLVRGHVAEAFLQGRDPEAQRRACGCRVLRLVHGRRRTVPAQTSPHDAATG